MASPDAKKSGKSSSQGKAKAKAKVGKTGKAGKTSPGKAVKGGKKKTEPRNLSTPVSRVKAKSGSKQGLIKEIQALTAKKDLLVERFSSKGIEHVSNAKLLRLHRILTEVTAQFPTRAALLDALLALLNRAKDTPYRDKLASLTLGRLWDMYRNARRIADRKLRGKHKGKPKAEASKG